MEKGSFNSPETDINHVEFEELEELVEGNQNSINQQRRRLAQKQANEKKLTPN